MKKTEQQPVPRRRPMGVTLSDVGRSFECIDDIPVSLLRPAWKERRVA